MTDISTVNVHGETVDEFVSNTVLRLRGKRHEIRRSALRAKELAGMLAVRDPRSATFYERASEMLYAEAS